MSVICFSHARLSCESHAHALLSAPRFQRRGAGGLAMSVAAGTVDLMA